MPREEIVPVSAIPDPIRCPECGGGNLEVKGNLLRESKEVWVNGEVTSTQIDEESDLIYDINDMLCSDCKVMFHIVEDAVFDLHKSNVMLSRQLMLGAKANKVC